MNIVTVPARTGITWAREGARLLFTKPLALTSLVGIYLLMVVAPTVVPVIGPAVGGVLLPFATLALMLACREVAAKRLPTLRVFAAPFADRERRGRLMQLGILYAALTLAFAAAFDLFDLDIVQAPVPASVSVSPTEPASATGSLPATTEVPAGPSSQPRAPSVPPTAPALLRFDALLLQLLLLTPLFMAMWFAPVLVGWHLMTPMKAMFFSFFACWRNKWPILVFGAASLATAALGSAMLALAVSFAGLGPVAANLVLAPWALGLTAFLYAAMYPMYRSVIDDPMQA